MDYSFNGEIATLYGVDEAVFIHNMYWWIRKNEVNGRHFYEGKSWTYNSMQAFADLFPFWSKKQVRRIIDNLKAKGVLLVGNFNDKAFDRTQWYALDDSIFEIYGGQNGHMHLPKQALSICPNGHITSAHLGTPIPDSKPYSKPDNNMRNSEMFAQFWAAYPKKKNKGDAEKAFKAIRPDDVLFSKMLEAIEQQKKSTDWREQCGKFIPYPASWLRAKGWENETQPQQKNKSEVNWLV